MTDVLIKRENLNPDTPPQEVGVRRRGDTMRPGVMLLGS